MLTSATASCATLAQFLTLLVQCTCDIEQETIPQCSFVLKVKVGCSHVQQVDHCVDKASASRGKVVIKLPADIRLIIKALLEKHSG